MVSFAGDRLVRERERAGLSRRKFLNLVRLFQNVRISEETLRKQEAGEADPRWSHVVAYARVLGLAVTAFDPR